MTVLLAANQVSTDFEDYAHLSDYLKFYLGRINK